MKRHFGNPGSYGGNDGFDEPARPSNRAAGYFALAVSIFVIGLLAYL